MADWPDQTTGLLGRFSAKQLDQLQKISPLFGNSYYIFILNRIVTPLVACSMDYPCDAQSDYMISYCLGLRDSMFIQACDNNLEDFYFNFYIGAKSSICCAISA